jgi:hypothetical protein
METILLDIKIPQGEITKAETEVARLTGEIEKLRVQQKKNAEEFGKGSVEYARTQATIKALSQEQRENERVLIANTKAQNSNDSSVQQLRAQLSAVSVQWSKLSQEERNNTDRGKELTQSKKGLTEELKRLEGATGDNRRNVGNYSEGMRDALGATGALGKGTLALFDTMKANPLILLATLLSGLIAKVANTQAAMDALDKIIQPLNAMFERFVGIVQEAVQNVLPALTKALANPQEALKDLGQAILDNFINRFTAVGKIIKAIVEGEWKDLGNAVIQLGTGFENVGDKVGKFGEQMKQAAKDGQRIADLNIKIADAQNALEISEAKLNRTIEEQKAILGDLSKTSAQRQEAAKKATEAVNELERQKIDILDLEIEKKALLIKQNDTDRKAQGEYNKLIAEREEAARQSATRQKEITSQLNSVNNQVAREEQARIKEKAMAEEQARKDSVAAAKEEARQKMEIAKQELADSVSAAKIAATEEINIAKQKYLDGTLSREEYNQGLKDLQLKALETERAILEAAGQSVIDIDSRILDFKIANSTKEVEITEVTQDQKTTLISSGAKAAGDIFGQQSVAYKLLSSAEAAMNTYTAATVALKTPIVGQLQAALITIQGLAQVAKINATPLPKFAGGVIGINGNGHGTSDSIPAMISRGESVVTAKATSVFAPQLAAMERSVGNRPNFQLGSKRFANGIIGMGANAERAAVEIRELRNSRIADNFRQTPIYVSLTELNKRQSELSSATSFASVTE